MHVHLTPTAVDKVRHIRFIQGKDDHGVRVHIAGGGICAGFEYLVALDNDPQPTDHVQRFEDVSVYVSPDSAEFMDGATIDYQITDEGEGFTIDLLPGDHACCCERPA